jgi:hypothetical protein
MTRTDGSAEKSDRPIVHAWCVRVNINETRCQDPPEDHHQGLVHARRLRTAAEGDEAHQAEATAKDFLDFWQRDTAIHFRIHEPALV